MSCFTHKYPYSSNRELNLDWLIAKINARKVLNLEVVENVDGGYDLVIYFADSDPVTVHLFSATEITAEDIYDLFEDSETITKALNDGKISFTAESSIYPVIYGQTSYADAFAALTAGKQLIAFYLEDNKYIQIPFKTKNADTMNFSTVIDDIGDGKIVIRLALNQLTGWDSRIQSLVAGDDLLTIIDDTETIVADLNEDDHLEFSASYENIVQPLARSLKTPISAPVEKKLVGFDENRDQMNLGIGHGLKVENDDLKLDESVLPDPSPLTPVDSLPSPTETEFNKHLLYYDNTKQIKYINKTQTNERFVLLSSNIPVNPSDIVTINGEIYIIGHTSEFAGCAIYKYDKTNLICTKLIDIPNTTQYDSFKIVGNNPYYVIKLYNSSIKAYTYDITLNQLTEISSFPVTDTRQLIVYYNNYIYFFGETGIKKYNISTNTYTTITETYKPIGNGFHQEGNLLYYLTSLSTNNFGIIQYNLANENAILLKEIVGSTTDDKYKHSNGAIYKENNKLYIACGGMRSPYTSNIDYYDFETNEYSRFYLSFPVATEVVYTTKYNDTHIFIIKDTNKRIYELTSDTNFDYLSLLTNKSTCISPFTVVSTLPTANETEYAKHLLYLDTTNGKIKYIVFDGTSTYSYKSIATET